MVKARTWSINRGAETVVHQIPGWMNKRDIRRGESKNEMEEFVDV